MTLRPPLPLQEVAPIVVDSNSDAAVACNQLTEALRKYALARKHMPASVDELVQAGYVRGVPAPPAGKQYALDLAHSAVVLVKK